MGNEAFLTLNDVTEVPAEFTVTGWVPIDFSVKVSCTAPFTAISPKLRLAALTESCGAPTDPRP
jgi:hypothetical protein